MKENTVNRGLTQEEIGKISSMVKALSGEELEVVLENLPRASLWKELMRRDNERELLLARVKSAMKGV